MSVDKSVERGLAESPALALITFATVVMGAAPVEFEGATRNTFVYGVTADAPEVWRMGVRAGDTCAPSAGS